MFSKVLIALCVLSVASAQEWAEQVTVQLCDNGVESGEKYATEFELCSNMTMGEGVLYYKVFKTSTNGTLTGLLDTFTDDNCMNSNVTGAVVTCACDMMSEVHFVCDGAAFAIPSILILAASLAVYML